MNERNREALAVILGRLTLLALWIAWPFVGICVLYMSTSLLGASINELTAMSRMVPPDPRYVDYVSFSTFAVKATYIGGIVLIVAYSLRCWHGTEVGAVLTVLGAGLLFGLPFVFPAVSPRDQIAIDIIAKYFATLQKLGFIALVPGTMFVLRDAILGIVNRMSKTSLEIKKGSGERILVKKPRKPLVLSHCWDMPNCSEALRKICPEFQKRRNCWRVKHGCLCDQRMVMRAAGLSTMQKTERDAQLGSEGPQKPIAHLTPALKRARCRTCAIYLEHQRQKFRIFSALVVPAALALIVGFYSQISDVMKLGLVQAEKFLRFLTYDPSRSDLVFQQGLDTLALVCVIWLGVLIISLLFRLVEYFIFELKV